MYKGRLFNREQIYISGDYLDGDIYPVFQPAGKRRKKCKPSRECQKRLNQISSERALARTIEANADAGWFWFHPTFRPEELPMTLKDVYRELSNFRSALKYRYDKAGVTFKYIQTVEYGKNGKPHAHMLLPGGVLDRDGIERLWESKHGRSNCDRLKLDRDTGAERVARYMCKPGKESPEGKERVYKKWSCSRNCVRPEPQQIDGQISMGEIEALAEAVDAGAGHTALEKHVSRLLERMAIAGEAPAGWDLVEARTYRNEFNRGVYVHFEMRRRRE